MRKSATYLQSCNRIGDVGPRGPSWGRITDQRFVQAQRQVRKTADATA